MAFRSGPVRTSPIGAGARQHHLANVVPLRPPVAVNPRHPSLYEPPSLFDQEDPDVHAADRCVILTEVEAKAIIGVLRHARGHCPSPAALNEAIALLDLAAGRVPCTCEQSDAYRQLDRSCPQHGDAADARRRQGDA